MSLVRHHPRRRKNKLPLHMGCAESFGAAEHDDQPTRAEPMTPPRAAIVLARPVRADRVGYRAVLFHTNGATQISLRLGYDAAVAFAEQRGAVIAFDEHAKRLADEQPKCAAD